MQVIHQQAEVELAAVQYAGQFRTYIGVTFVTQYTTMRRRRVNLLCRRCNYACPPTINSNESKPVYMHTGEI